jgi:alpha-L-arabinofuranosidase
MNRILRIALVSIVVARTTGMVAAVVAFASVAYGQVAPVDVINLTVDVAGAKAEISPLVYGQFIEHLGRCIRDGIWAEKLGDAVTVARALHVMLRNADVVGMANWPQTVNVIGAIKTTRNHACLDAVGHLLTLYRARVNGRNVPLPVPAGSPLDAAAAWDAESGILTLALVNTALDRQMDVVPRVAGMPAGGTVELWQISGEIQAFNTPGQSEQVSVKPLGTIAPDKPIRLPPHSITVAQVRKPQ